jgi:TolB-like protein
MACLLLVHAAAQTNESERSVVLTVLPFRSNADPAYAYIGQSFSEALTTKLVGLKRVKIYERSQFDKLAAELKLEKDAAGFFDPATLARTGAVVSIDYALLGSVTQAGNSLSCSVRVVHVNSGRIILAKELRGNFPSEVFSLQDRAAMDVATSLAIRVDDMELKRLSRKPTENPDAYSLYNHALANPDKMERVRLLEAAVARDASFSMARHLLADAYMEVGYVEGGMTSYKKIIEVDPNDYRAHYNLGLLSLDQGLITEARALFSICVVLKPGDADAFYHLGLSHEFCLSGERYGAEAEIPKALVSYMDAAALDRRHVESRLGAGILSAMLASREMDVQKRLSHLRDASMYIGEYLVLSPDSMQFAELSANLELIDLAIAEHEAYLGN